MNIPELLINLLKNDLAFVEELKSSFDGMIVKQNLESLRDCQPGQVIESKIESALSLYKHDGKQCFSNEDRPQLIILLREILAELTKITNETES